MKEETKYRYDGPIIYRGTKMNKKAKYRYDGPIYKCDKFICNWKGETWAVSDAKALANLAYRFKTSNNMLPGTKITLDPDFLAESTAIDDAFEVYHQMTLDELFI